MMVTFVNGCKLVIQSEVMAVCVQKGVGEEVPRLHGCGRDRPRLSRAQVRPRGRAITAGCGKALVVLENKLEGLMPRGGSGANCTAPLPPAALRQLEYVPGLDNALIPEAILPRTRRILVLRSWVVCHARAGAMLGFIAILRRVSPGRLTDYA